MKPEQAELARLRREVIKLKAERDILNKPRPPSRRRRCDVRLHCEASGDLAGGMVVLGARCLARRLLCLADPAAECPGAGGRAVADQRTGQLPHQRSHLRRAAGQARPARGGHRLRPPSH